MTRLPPLDTPERQRTSRLGDVLNRLMGRANLRKSELARRAGISAATLTNLSRGCDLHQKPTFPNPDLLRQIAYGLATNGLGERDDDAADRAYIQLMEAIGYMSVPSVTHQSPLPPEVVAILAEHPELVVEIQQTAEAWTPHATKMLIDAIADYRRRFVQGNDHPHAHAQ